VRKDNLYTVVKGLYETNRNTPGYLLSAYIYGPSYLSFDYALSYHGLIPEKVVTYTCATFNKRKSKTYSNIFGTFSYRDVPKNVYPYGIKVNIVEKYSYFIATKEKALCDKLYISQPQTSMKKLKELMFDDLRIDVDLFYELDTAELLFLCDRYKSSNLKLLKKIILKEMVKDDDN
jgi:predicted transcriptional regulator of viral defense system